MKPRSEDVEEETILGDFDLTVMEWVKQLPREAQFSGEVKGPPGQARQHSLSACMQHRTQYWSKWFLRCAETSLVRFYGYRNMFIDVF